MAKTNPNAPKCPVCGVRQAGTVAKPDMYGGLCRHCYDAKRNDTAKLPADLQKLVAEAQKTGNWRELAEQLQPTMTAIAQGIVKTNAAQVAVLNMIFNRAYGKVTKSQEDAKGPVGVIVLPALGEAGMSQLCPLCVEAHRSH